MNSLEQLDNLYSDNDYNSTTSDLVNNLLTILTVSNNDKLVTINQVLHLIETKFGVNLVCRYESLQYGYYRTLLDALVQYLEMYFDYDERSEIHDLVANLVIELIKRGAKCARDLSYSYLEQTYGEVEANLRHCDSVVDSYLYIFKCLGYDEYRFKYLRMMLHEDIYPIRDNIINWIDTLIYQRIFDDAFDANYIIATYDELFGLESKCCHGEELIEYLLKKDIVFLYQWDRDHVEYKRISKLIESIIYLKKNRK